MVTLIEAHAEGEVGRVVTGGLPAIPGRTPAEKMDHLNTVDDGLRRFLVFEPRGAAQMSTNVLVPTSNSEADAAFLILQADRVHAMSGSNSICVVTVLLETGLVPMKEPESIVTLETAAGLVKARARCRGGKCEQVTLDMPPAFVEVLDRLVEVPGLGQVSVDIAFGGCFYALVDAGQLGLAITPANAKRLVDAGMRVQQTLNREAPVVHPEIRQISGISYTMLTGRNPEGELVGATILPPGRIDRSPCGTGNAARMAVRLARGEVGPGTTITARSTIGSKFEVELYAHGKIAGRPAALTRVTGRGWIHGMQTLALDPTDPFPQGFLLSDTWGEAIDLLN
jgi:proline racemase